MADHAFALYPHLQQNGIPIAIGRSADYFEPVAGSLALGPKLIASAAEKRDIPGPQRLFKRFTIHEAKHEHFATARILHNGRQQSLHFVEINFPVRLLYGHKFSKSAAKNKKPAVANRVSGPNLVSKL
jgi:hypothetical protein